MVTNGTTISTVIWPVWPYNVNPKNRMILEMLPLFTKNAVWAWRCIEQFNQKKVCWTRSPRCSVYRLVIPLPKGPSGNLRSCCKFYYENLPCSIATCDSFLSCHLPQQPQSSIHNKFKNLITTIKKPIRKPPPPWGQNAQWPPLSWPRNSVFHHPKRLPPQAFPPRKIWKKANLLKDPIKEAT